MRVDEFSPCSNIQSGNSNIPLYSFLLSFNTTTIYQRVMRQIVCKLQTTLLSLK